MNTADCHETAFALLPWFVNDSLAGEERKLVEAHLGECLSCRAELKAQRHLAALVESHPTVHISAEQSFETLLRAIDRPRRHPARAWLPATLLVPPRLGSAFGVLAAAALIALFAATTGDLDGGAYRTLTRAPATAAGPTVDVVLAPGLGEPEALALAAEVGGRIVAGPSALGRYTIALGATASDRDLPALIERLERDPRVRFAGRDYTPPAESTP